MIVTFASILGGMVLGIGTLTRAFEADEDAVGASVCGRVWPCFVCLEPLLCSRNPRFMVGELVKRAQLAAVSWMRKVACPFAG
jgi:hypothetical protein